MTTIDHGPARISSLLAVITGGIAVIAIATPLAVAIGIASVLILATGLATGSRQTVSLGAGGLLAGVIVAALQHAPPEPLLVGTVAAVIAWDTGEHAINVGEQLGRAADTRRCELAHFATTTLVGITAVIFGYVVFRLASGGQPVTALVLLLVAAVALMSVLHN